MFSLMNLCRCCECLLVRWVMFFYCLWLFRCVVLMFLLSSLWFSVCICILVLVRLVILVLVLFWLNSSFGLFCFRCCF